MNNEKLARALNQLAVESNKCADEFVKFVKLTSGLDMPPWAELLVRLKFHASGDHHPYYWTGDGMYKRLISKNRIWHGELTDTTTIFKVSRKHLNKGSKRGRFGLRQKTKWVRCFK